MEKLHLPIFLEQIFAKPSQAKVIDSKAPIIRMQRTSSLYLQQSTLSYGREDRERKYSPEKSFIESPCSKAEFN